MTKTVTRYTQPCIQIQHSPEFSTAEVPLFEDPNGKWVRYDDIKHLLAAEPKAPQDASNLARDYCHFCKQPLSAHDGKFTPGGVVFCPTERTT